MKRFSEHLLLGGFLGGLLLLTMASCSSTASPPAPLGGGTNTGTGGSSAMSHGGTNSATGGSGVGIGGNGLPQGGTGTVGTGGAGTVAGSAGVSSGTGGAGGVAAMCSTDTNLVNATGCFVGCDPALSTDNPNGIQGAFYTFGDGASCTQPLTNPPCTTAGICLSGSTVVDPTYAKYGCGMGLELNATGGLTSMKQPFTGSVSCFDYTLSGDSGGDEVRIGFTQTADTTNRVSPYVSIPAFNGTKTGTICTKDVTCPTPAPVPPNCALTGMSYDLQILVVGGNHAGPYHLCLTSLKPTGSGTTTLGPICGVAPETAAGAGTYRENVGKYFVQNNVNNAGSGMQCVTPTQNGTAVGLTVNATSLPDPGNAPAAYPSIVDGWHYGHLSPDTALPKLVSQLMSVNSSVTYTGSNGKYDAAYDIWVLPAATGTTPAGGLEVMIWLNDSGVNPAGNSAGTFDAAGGTWNVFSAGNGTVGNWSYVAFSKLGQNSFNGDLLPFIKKAIATSGLGGTPYLAGIEFGFELWQPGTFSVTSFSSTVL